MDNAHHRTQRIRGAESGAVGCLTCVFRVQYTGAALGERAMRRATRQFHPGSLTGRPCFHQFTSIKGALMRTRLSRAVMAAAVGLAVTPLAGCRQFSGLKAKMALKDANVAYGDQDYRKAMPKYEEAISLDPNFSTPTSISRTATTTCASLRRRERRPTTRCSPRRSLDYKTAARSPRIQS